MHWARRAAGRAPPRMAGSRSATKSAMMPRAARNPPTLEPRPVLGFGMASLNSGSLSKLADMDMIPDSPCSPAAPLHLLDVSQARSVDCHPHLASHGDTLREPDHPREQLTAIASGPPVTRPAGDQDNLCRGGA